MPSLRLLPLAAAAVLLTAVSVAGLPAADATTRTSTGLRCTKVGTPHNDRIVGTSHRDVICGGGGNDLIYGGGGNDVIDGGPGNDRISAGAGNDRVVAGSGNDVVDAGSGNDVVDAGSGDDRVHGVTGNDRLSGGPDDDVLSGDAGNDTVHGDAGDDNLSGGYGVDILDGGPGFNWCDVASGEHHGDCAVDAAAPGVREIRLSATSVDVSQGPVTVTALVHATDDTGLRSVMLQADVRSTGRALDGTLLSRSIGGYPRDGWWKFSIVVPRYLASTDVDVYALATDRVNRRTWSDAVTLPVVGNDPDVVPPTVLGTSFAPDPVDVRTDSNWANLRARVSDDKSGVDEVMACPYHRFVDGYRPGAECQVLSRTSGTAMDGWWGALWMVPQGSLSGDWDIHICVMDKSRQSPQQCWIGPGEAAYDQANGITETAPRLPAGSGSLTVRGTDDDTHSPVLNSVRLVPGTIDASQGARTAYVDVAASDVEGIMNIRTRLFAEDDPDMRSLDSDYDGTIISGDARNGVWRFRVEVPGGTPPGRYWVQTWIEDNTHQLGWQPASHLSGATWQAYTLDQTPDGDALVVQ